VQRPLRLVIHDDNPSGFGYPELEVGVARNSHELDITQPPQDVMVWPREVDHLKRERLGVVVTHVSEGDR
jgi:hypothetical protein